MPKRPNRYVPRSRVGALKHRFRVGSFKSRRGRPVRTSRFRPRTPSRSKDPFADFLELANKSAEETAADEVLSALDQE